MEITHERFGEAMIAYARDAAESEGTANVDYYVTETLAGVTALLFPTDERKEIPMEIVHDPGEHGESPRLTRIFMPSDEPHRSLVTAITWQDGPIKKHGINGVQTEDILQILIDRLTAFQAGAFPCAGNENALASLLKAKEWLDERMARRVSQAVEGLNQAHQSP